jgi:hypothetical protein
MSKPEGAQAEGQALTTLMQQPAAFGALNSANYGNYAKAFGDYSQGLAGLGNATANNYGFYAGGLGNLAQAQANAQNNNQLLNTGYNSMAEAARQGALSNLGSAALGAYGSASGSAMGAWAQNQMAYNKMLSDLGAANQTGLSQLGQSRNNALGNLGGSYAKAGIGMAVANALPSMDFGGLGGGFQATGPDGEIASGSFSSPQRSRPAAPQFDGAQMFAGLDATRGDLNSTDIADRLDRNYANTLGMANAQHMSSREMPSQMLGQTLSGLMAMNKYNVDASSQGMDQYYGNVTTIDPRRPPREIAVRDILSGLTGGYSDSANRLTGLADQMGSGWGDVGGELNRSNSALAGLWNSTLGKNDIFQTPTEKLQAQRAADLYQRGADYRDGMARNQQRNVARDRDLEERLNAQLAQLDPNARESGWRRSQLIAQRDAEVRKRDGTLTDPWTYQEHRGIPWYDAAMKYLPQY